MKVKQFIILTGNSGTGKTKLAKLFAEYLDDSKVNDTYFTVKVKSNFSSWSNKGWTLDKSFFLDLLPIRECELDCIIDVGGISAEGKINLSIQLFYDSEELKNYFKKLYEEDRDNPYEIDLKINYGGIKNILDDYEPHNGIINLKQNSNKSAFKERQWFMNNEFFKYVPFKSGFVNCNIVVGDIESNANLRIYPRLSFKKNNLLQNYLMKHDGEEVSVKLKLDDFKFNEFKIEEDKDKVKGSFKVSGKNYKIIPIGANWTDNTNIIGYYNIIDEKYHFPPAYDLIKEADLNHNKPYFLILDEMNLSHVERYFADFLSAIESGEDIPLNGCDKSLKLSKNLFIIGTVNIDETTYMFSPKVLDRANTIEFNTVLATDYMLSNSHEDKFNGDVEFLQCPLSDLELINCNVDELKNILVNVSCNDGNLWEILANELSSFQKILKEPGFDFGFRVINEILRFMIVAWKYEGSNLIWDDWQRYFDAQIKQKILPKLHGSEKAMGKVLINLFNFCLKDEVNTENIRTFTVSEDNCKYYSSALKLQDMYNVLSDQRYVSFIN